MLPTRVLSARALDTQGMMADAQVVDGSKLESAIESLFATPDAACLQAHFAGPGCHAVRIDRV